MTSKNYLQESLRNFDLLRNRNPGLEPGDWPLADKLRLMAIEIDINHATNPSHEIQDDLRRAADNLELHAMVTDTQTLGHFKSIQTIVDLIYLEGRNQTCEPFETTKVTTALLISEAARGKAQAIRADRKDVTS